MRASARLRRVLLAKAERQASLDRQELPVDLGRTMQPDGHQPVPIQAAQCPRAGRCPVASPHAPDGQLHPPHERGDVRGAGRPRQVLRQELPPGTILSSS